MSSTTPQWTPFLDILRNAESIFIDGVWHAAQEAHSRLTDPDQQTRLEPLLNRAQLVQIVAAVQDLILRELNGKGRKKQALPYLIALANPTQRHLIRAIHAWPPTNPSVIPQTLEHLCLRAYRKGLKIGEWSTHATVLNLATYFNLVLDMGNSRKYWYVPLLEDMVVVLSSQNPQYTPLEKGWLRIMPQLRKRVQAFIEKQRTLHTLPVPVRRGLLLWSLMHDTHITDVRLLAAVLDKLCTLDSIGFVAGRMAISVRTDPKLPARLYILSPLTAAMVLRVRAWSLPSLQSGRRAVARAQMREALQALCDAAGLQPPFKGLSSWCMAMLAAHTALVPGLILSHQRGQAQGFSPYIESQRRMLPFSDQLGLSGDAIRGRQSRMGHQSTYAADINWVRGTLNITGKSATKIRHHMNARFKTQPLLRPVVSLLFDWCLSRIYPDPDNTSMVGRSPYQMLKRFDSIARHLVLMVGDEDLMSMNPSERARVYEAVKEQAISDNNLRTITASLYAFEKWLGEKAAIEARGAFGHSLAKHDTLFEERQERHIGVNAHLITVDDYLTARDALLELSQRRGVSALKREQARLAALMLILGFRLGLRWAEAVGLRCRDIIVDLDTDDPFEIIVRPHEVRTLKTQNAHRTLPINVLLDEKEQALLCGQLKSLKKRKDSFLISRAGSPDTPYDTPDLRKRVVDSLKASTDNEALRYHHLRHSFASWLMLSLGMAQWQLPADELFAHLPETAAWLKASAARAEALLCNPTNTNQAGYRLAELLGHGSLGTSLYHYVHTMDLLIGLYLESRVFMRYRNDAVSILTGIAEPTLKGLRYKKRKTSWSVLIQRQLLERIKGNAAATVLLERQQASQQASHPSWPDLLQKMVPDTLLPWEATQLRDAHLLILLGTVNEQGCTDEVFQQLNMNLPHKIRKATLKKVAQLALDHLYLRLPALKEHAWEDLAVLSREFQKAVAREHGKKYPLFEQDTSKTLPSVDALIRQAVQSATLERRLHHVRFFRPDKLIWRFSLQETSEAKAVLQLFSWMGGARLTLAHPKAMPNHHAKSLARQLKEALQLHSKSHMRLRSSGRYLLNAYLIIQPRNPMAHYLLALLYLRKVI